MRNSVIEALIELAAHDERIVLLTGDLGFTVVDKFADRYPERFFNVGVAEQNMVGIATGLAEAGFIPYVYSIANFITMRPYEFVRNGPIHHNLPVRLLGIGGGCEYSLAGFSHHSFEDIGLMRMQPGMTTIIPIDCAHAANAVKKTKNLMRPIYFRLSKEITTFAHGPLHFELGQGLEVKKGDDLLIISMGAISHRACEIAERCSACGISTGLFIVSAFNPSPDEDMCNVLKNYRCCVSLEEHYVVGGVGSYVAEIIADNGLETQLLRCGVRVSGAQRGGKRMFLLQQLGLDNDAVYAAIQRFLKCNMAI